MLGGFQVGPFQTNFQQSGVAPPPVVGFERVERILFDTQDRIVFNLYKPPRIVYPKIIETILVSKILPRLVFPTKESGVTMILKPAFNFISAMGVSDTILTAVVTATVFTGIDANPSAIISGSASISGTTVTQKITGGVSGVIYDLLCTVTTSAGDTLTQAGFLAIDPDLVT